MQLGTNLTGKVEGKKLTIEIDLDKTFGQSASGKSTIVATTSGNVAIPGTAVKLGINAYIPTR